MISKNSLFKISCLQFFAGKPNGIFKEFKYSTLFNCRERLKYMEGGRVSTKNGRGEVR